MYLLSIDPGLKAVGCCLFQEGIPISAFTVRSVTPETVLTQFLRDRPTLISDLDRRHSEVLIEQPDAWTRGGTNVKAIMRVSNVAHVLWAMFESYRLQGKDIHPVLKYVSEIKGATPKAVTDFEAKHVYPGVAKNEHERDAMYNGLWWWSRRTVERFTKKGGSR